MATREMRDLFYTSQVYGIVSLISQSGNKKS